MHQLTMLTSDTNPQIQGLVYMPNYISADQEAALIDLIDGQPWITSLRRRVQHYGYRYDYVSKNIQNQYLGAMPSWLLQLCSSLKGDDIFHEEPNQVIVNEYFPGQGIASHIDCEPCFGEVICSLSLGGVCVMDFINGEKVPILLEQRSLLVLSKDARYHWRHGIAARKKDIYLGTKILRKRRISLTFRNVINASSY